MTNIIILRTFKGKIVVFSSIKFDNTIETAKNLTSLPNYIKLYQHELFFPKNRKNIKNTLTF